MELKYLGVLFTSEGKKEREMDRWIGAASAVMRALYRSIVVKLLIYRSIYVTTLTSRALGSDRKNEIGDTSGRNEFPPQGGWAQP